MRQKEEFCNFFSTSLEGLSGDFAVFSVKSIGCASRDIVPKVVMFISFLVLI